MIDQIMLILARLFIIDGEILRDLGDFVRCTGQTYKFRMKGAYIVFQHLRRIPLGIDGDKNWLHLGRTCRILFFEERSEEHTSELQSLMRISYAVFCLKKKKKTKT